MNVEKYAQSGEGFWELMGPMFASAKVKRDLGIAMSSDESYQWFLAFNGSELAGFCAVVPGKSVDYLKHLYAIDGAKVEVLLLGSAIAASTKTIQATAKESEVHHYLKQGFKEVKQRGQYKILERK